MHLNFFFETDRGIVSLPSFFAKEIQEAFKGFSLKESKLTRIIVSRSEIDLQDIKEEFEHHYESSLEKAVEVSVIRPFCYFIKKLILFTTKINKIIILF